MSTPPLSPAPPQGNDPQGSDLRSSNPVYPHTLAALAHDFLQSYYAHYPTMASSLGLHDYDGAIVNLSASSIAARLRDLHLYQQRLLRIDPAHLEGLAAFDYALLDWQINGELWRLREEREHLRNPMVHAYNAMVDNYLKRDYAPLPERVAALTRHLDLLPDAMQIARDTLAAPVPQVYIEEAQSIFVGLVDFLNETLPASLPDLAAPQDTAALWAARDRANAALTSFQAYMRDTLLPTAHDDFRLGAERFAAMLRANELIELPLDTLLRIGMDDLARNQAALLELTSQLDPTRSVQEQMQALGLNHPQPEQLIPTTQTLLADLRTFLVERDLISLPEHAICQVEATPPFARWAFAMMDTAGPFEQQATESFYYVTLPEPGWSREQVAGWMSKFDYATMTAVSIHEAYPGHYVHFAAMRDCPSELAKVFPAYSHYESWAHYVEQMMVEQGYASDNPHFRMAQLGEALLRNCRHICAIRLHAQDMTEAEATRFFMEHAYMDAVTASKEARRGTHDPGYINYTLGKLLLLRLRDEYQQTQGATFSLKQFHNEYIRYGAPPIPILRQLLLPNAHGPLL
jgi:uncharacterized protein (DUF885 family)